MRSSTSSGASGTSSRRRIARRAFALASLVLLFFVGATVLTVLLLRHAPPPGSAFMWRARRADPATGRPCDELSYRWVDGSRIAPSLALAVVLAEDQRFLLHDGFDTRAIRRAVAEGVRGGRVRGASTLSQQVAKNLFLWPGRSLARKGLEAWFTLWLEALWPKQRILEVYLNVAQFGPCVFGAEAASERFFAKPAAELTPEESALLAAVLPNPRRLRAHDPGPYARERTAEILSLMEEHGGQAHLRGLL